MVKLVKRIFSKHAGLLMAAAMILLLSGSNASAFNFDVKGTDVTIGGYIKATLAYDINNIFDNTNSPYQGDLFNVYSTVLDNDPAGKDKKDDLRFVARESRLFVKTSSKFDGAVIGTHLEGDFFGTSDVGAGGGYETWSNQYSLRMRHAYGTVTKGEHSLLLGQTWSTFMDLPGYTPAMDFNGDLGTPFARQTMVRYTYSFAKGNSLTIAVENPDTGLVGPPGNFVVQSRASENQYPDTIVKYWYGGSWGHISPKIIVRHFKLNDEEATAVGGFLSGHLNLSKHKLYFGAMYGDGLGRYGGLGVISGAGLTAQGDIELVPFYSAYLGTQLYITEEWKFNAGVGYSKTDKDAYTDSDAVLGPKATSTARSLRAFFTYKPYPILEYALGVVYGDREVMNGQEGDGTRIQGYAQFSF